MRRLPMTTAIEPSTDRGFAIEIVTGRSVSFKVLRARDGSQALWPSLHESHKVAGMSSSFASCLRHVLVEKQPLLQFRDTCRQPRDV